jgi:predicted RNA-binding protein YlxR (DUF448 family)
MPPRRIPQRSCIGCRTVRGQRELLRIVRDADGGMTLDMGQRLPGRGAYLCPDPRCVARGLRPKTLERAFKVAIAPAALAGIQAALEHHFQVRKVS